MLKKMQRRFILSAMTAFGLVLFAVALGINLANYHRTVTMEDDLIDRLLSAEQENMEKSKAPGPHPPVENMPGRGPEAAFMTRFFTVHCDAAGNIKDIARDYIFSVDERTAGDYAEAVLLKGKERGCYGEYRYRVMKDPQGMTLLFLNVGMDLQFMRSLLFLSFLIGICSLALVFVLVLVFSRYAIRPYVKNMERQKRFITDAGHELKTPVTSIATSADIAAMEYEGDEWIENIKRQAARLAKLTGDLVALARLDEEAPFPERSTFSLSDAAWEGAEPFSVLAKAEGKKFTQDIEENLTLSGDRDTVLHLLSIFLDNAMRYSEEGGEIRLSVYQKRRKAFIEVFNTCSLPENCDLERLFDRFYRMDESRASHTGGTGIGLSMARAIVENHGGQIGAESEDKRSILFRAVLPVGR